MRFLLLCLMLLFPKATQAYEPVRTPGLRLVLQARVTVDLAVEVGASDHGKRRFIAITGGTFTGDGIRGEVITSGASAIDGSDAMSGAVNFKGPTDNGYAIIAGNVRMPVGQQVQFQNAPERKTAFGNFDYEVAEGVTAYGQFMYVDSVVNTDSGGSLTQIGNLTTIPTTNPFIPADLRTILASRPNPNAPFTWNGRYVGVADKNWDEQYKVSQFALGLS